VIDSDKDTTLVACLKGTVAWHVTVPPF
jgi:hypothetical protein